MTAYPADLVAIDVVRRAPRAWSDPFSAALVLHQQYAVVLVVCQQINNSDARRLGPHSCLHQVIRQVSG